MLELARELSRREPAAATAVERWETWQDALAAGSSGSRSRFERRAYERAREAAMGTIVMALARARRSGRADRSALRGRSRQPRRRRTGSLD